MLSEFRFAFRTLSKTPVITGVAVLSLALGIGANTAMFSLFNEILLKKLPVPASEDLVNLRDDGPKSGSNSNNQSGSSRLTFSYPMMRDLEKLQGKAIASIAAHRYFGGNISFRGQTTASNGIFVSGNFFTTYRVQPALGKLISPSDDEKPGGHPVVVLGHAYWQRQLGGSPDVINGTMTINGKAMTIIGVASQDFKGVTLGSNPDFYVPIAMREALSPGWKGIDNRMNYWIYIAARRLPGMSMDQAQNALNVTYHGIIQEVEAPLQKSRSTSYTERFGKKSLILEKGSQGFGSMRQEGSTALTLLLGITGFVLLIACANIANLLLARAANRSREIAIRLSIGASRWQLVRQLLAESLLLGLMGGAAGLVVARWTLYLLISMAPAQAMTFISETLDPVVLLFALAVSIFTGFLFGIFPALHSTSPNLAGTLKDQAGQVSATGTAARFRQILVVAQIALSLLLLISAGLFVKSLVNVTRVDLGIKSDNIVVFGISPELNGHNFARCVRLFERLEDSLNAIPGVNGNTVSMVPLIAGNNWGTSVAVDGFQTTPDTDTHSMLNHIGPEFFQTLGVRIVAGRAFTKADKLDSQKVAIVNEAFVRKFGLKDPASAIGKRMAEDGRDKTDIEIVGVAADTKYSEVKEAVPPLFFRPYRQNANFGSAAIYVRTSLDTNQLMGQIRKAVAEEDPQLPVERLRLTGHAPGRGRIVWRARLLGRPPHPRNWNSHCPRSRCRRCPQHDSSRSDRHGCHRNCHWHPRRLRIGEVFPVAALRA
jgi:predicted permease